jgi:hypothetical protein
MEIEELPILHWIRRPRAGTALVFVGKSGLDMYSFYPRGPGEGIFSALEKPITFS